MSTEFKNVTVCFSNMRNKLNKDLFSREFSIEVPSDSEQIKQLQADFKTLEQKAQTVFGEKEGKKVKGASKEKGVGAYLFGDEYKEGVKRLKFIIYNIREEEVTTEDGKTVKKLTEKLSPLYKDLDFCYKINNSGEKEYELESGSHWMPLSQNVIDLKCSLKASYNKTDNRVTIKLKADDVKIVSSNYQGKSSGGGYLSLDDEEVSAPKTTPKTTPKSKKQEETFTEDELSDLDI